MYHPNYAWMFLNWYKNGWWLANSSCTIESSIDPTNLERIVKSSLVFDHFPRIEDERKDEPNQGNIVRFIKLEHLNYYHVNKYFCRIDNLTCL